MPTDKKRKIPVDNPTLKPHAPAAVTNEDVVQNKGTSYFYCKVCEADWRISENLPTRSRRQNQGQGGVQSQLEKISNAIVGDGPKKRAKKIESEAPVLAPLNPMAPPPRKPRGKQPKVTQQSQTPVLSQPSMNPSLSHACKPAMRLAPPGSRFGYSYENATDIAKIVTPNANIDPRLRPPMNPSLSGARVPAIRLTPPGSQFGYPYKNATDTTKTATPDANIDPRLLAISRPKAPDLSRSRKLAQGAKDSIAEDSEGEERFQVQGEGDGNESDGIDSISEYERGDPCMGVGEPTINEISPDEDDRDASEILCEPWIEKKKVRILAALNTILTGILRVPAMNTMCSRRTVRAIGQPAPLIQNTLKRVQIIKPAITAFPAMTTLSKIMIPLNMKIMPLNMKILLLNMKRMPLIKIAMVASNPVQGAIRRNHINLSNTTLLSFDFTRPNGRVSSTRQRITTLFWFLQNAVSPQRTQTFQLPMRASRLRLQNTKQMGFL
jgi:hypothetical protein